MKPRRIGRLVKILTALQSGRTCTVGDLAKMFGSSRRTIFRDLKELQVIGVQCLYDSKARSYALDPEFFLPPLGFNLQEALSLLLLVRKTTKYIQTPFRNSALLAALKIENNLPVKIRKYCNESLKNITAHPNPQAPLETLDKTLAELKRPLLKNKKCICFTIHSLKARLSK
ncbi:helix-turn-helix transcriptional regulator [Planctomycetota bacterium]